MGNKQYTKDTLPKELTVVHQSWIGDSRDTEMWKATVTRASDNIYTVPTKSGGINKFSIESVLDYINRGIWVVLSVTPEIPDKTADLFIEIFKNQHKMIEQLEDLKQSLKILKRQLIDIE